MEIWKQIIGYEGRYEVSNLGRIKSLEKKYKNGTGGIITGKERILKQQIDNNGYFRVRLSSGNRNMKTLKVHRIVATAFLENTEDFPMVNHKDECKTNNFVDNLEWCNAKYNVNYGSGISKTREKNTNGKCSKPIFMKKNNEFHVFPSINQAERETGFSHSGIIMALKYGKIRYGREWGYIKNAKI